MARRRSRPILVDLDRFIAATYKPVYSKFVSLSTLILIVIGRERFGEPVRLPL